MPVILAASSSGGGSSFTPIILLIILVVFGYFVLIRPQRSRQRQARQLQDTLRVGSEVMTTAGLYGTVAAMDEETVTLEVSPGVHNRYIRAAIARVITPREDVVESEAVDTPEPDADDAAGPGKHPES